MNTYSKKAQEENLKYLIPLTVPTQISTLTDPKFNDARDADVTKPLNEEPSRSKNRSRTRDRRNRRNKNRSEAKFSDEQDQTTATSQVPKKEIPKSKLKKPTTFNDLAYYPKGSLLSLKTCSIEIPLKKIGKSDCRVQIVSEQQHKALISSFVDPGFTLLSIKKDKKEADIIQYLSQPTKKAYKYLVCWFEAVDPQENQLLLEIALEANEKKRIFGWHDDHIKLHIMSMRQLSMIPKFTAPSLFASQAAAKVLREERLVMIMQYPQRTYELKDLYNPFASISKKEEFKSQEVQFVPKETEKEPEMQPVVAVNEDQKSAETEGEAETPKKQWYQLIKIFYEGWDDIPKEFLYIDPSESPSSQPPAPSSINIKKIRPLPAFVQKIRQHFGFKIFEAISSDESEEEDKPDLATELLNQLMQFERRQSLSKQAVRQEIPHENHQNSHLFDYYHGQYYQPAQSQWNFNSQTQYEPYNQINNHYYQYQYQINQEQNQHCKPQGYNPGYNF